MTAMDSAQPRLEWSRGALHLVGASLIISTWISAAIFGAYIIAFYGGAVQDGALERWNMVLPRLYEPGGLAATIGVGVHFLAGAVLLLMGSVQFIPAIRARTPALHRWIGRLYVVCTLVAGLGGLLYIALKGTIGGAPMNIGFGLYGAFMVIAAFQAARHAITRRLDAHRAWATRLYALAIGSWLYRMYYGFWSLIAGGAGHTETFDGWFDVLMAFFFYIPNLLLAEIFIRARVAANPALRAGAAALLALATGFVLLGTYYFTLYAWWPAIADRIGLA